MRLHPHPLQPEFGIDRLGGLGQQAAEPGGIAAWARQMKITRHHRPVDTLPAKLQASRGKAVLLQDRGDLAGKPVDHGMNVLRRQKRFGKILQAEKRARRRDRGEALVHMAERRIEARRHHTAEPACQRRARHPQDIADAAQPSRRHRRTDRAVETQCGKRQTGETAGKLARPRRIQPRAGVTLRRRSIAGQRPCRPAGRRHRQPRRQPGGPQASRHIGKQRADSAFQMRRPGHIQPQPVAVTRNGGPGPCGLGNSRRGQRAIAPGPACQMQQIGGVGGIVAVARHQSRTQRPRIGKPHAGIQPLPRGKAANRIHQIGTMIGACQDQRRVRRQVGRQFRCAGCRAAHPFGRQMRKPGMNDDTLHSRPPSA